MDFEHYVNEVLDCLYKSGVTIIGKNTTTVNTIRYIGDNQIAYTTVTVTYIFSYIGIKHKYNKADFENLFRADIKPKQAANVVMAEIQLKESLL